MKIFKNILSAILAVALLPVWNTAAVHAQVSYTGTAFSLISTDKSEALGGTIYRYRHKKTGAEVIYNDNQAQRREFALGFKTPPIDSKGANHVLEHALFCGSEKYPTKNIMHYIQNGTSSLYLNGVTADDCTYYMINTENQTEYYNMIDVYLNGIFHPMFLHDENIFKQQGIRIEYQDGKAQYNGVVYNELRIKNLNTEENSVNFLADKLYRGIYGDTTPVFSAGGELDEIKQLTYEDLLRVYNTFYIPSNSMTYLAGNQDIEKTLDILDGFFSENIKPAPAISFEDTRQIPTEKVQECNIDENTKTVDIGFMSSGVPASAEPMDRYANEIVFDIIKTKVEQETGCTKTYISGGSTGGISALALMLSEVPIEKKDEVISAYHKVLKELDEKGLDESEIDSYNDDDYRYFYQNFDRVFLGLLYKDNPLAFTEITQMRKYFKEHKEYFNGLLKKYFTENPYSITVVSGNGTFGTEDSSANVSAEELEKIKRETEEFQKWNDAEDDPSIIEKIPFLTLDEVKNAPEKAEPKHEKENGIDFYFTDKTDDTSASVYFPLDIASEDLDYVNLMREFWQYQAEKYDIDVFPSIVPLQNAKNSDKINPHINLWFSGENVSDSLKKAVEFLHSEEMWNADDLKKYISLKPKEIHDSYFDPYYLSGAMKDSALSAEGRFSVFVPLNTIVKGSPHYYHFLQNIDTNDMQRIIGKMKAISEKLIVSSKPVVEYVGNTDKYNQLKTTVSELFSNGVTNQPADLKLPPGYYSAATVTKLADANHFMLAAPIENYSGKMAVLGKVLSTKYITPTMRGKYGAYGCSISFRENEMTSAVTGLQDIDFTIAIWEGMGDYLRNLDMTQHELNSFIVAAVQEYDQWDYKESEYGASFALKEKSADTCDKVRDEMLSTTVEDLKNYSDFIDNLVSEKRVFAVLGKSAADNAKFNFAYYADDKTLNVIPMLTKTPRAYIQGKAENLFAPEDCITRAEFAALLSRLIADPRGAQFENTFTDITQNDWYYDAVLSMAEKGIMLGESGAFLPEKAITRAELAAVLSKFIFQGTSETQTQYADMTEDDWFYEPMTKMIHAGYLQGDEDGSLRPNDSVTRAETVALLNRMLNIVYNDNAQTPFEDINPTHWAYKDILAAVR